MGPVLELRALSKHFPNHRALSELSLSVEPGEFFSILGPSGCGKTTTLRLIAGFDHPTSGDILLRGDSLLPLPPHARNLSTVFQNYALFPHLNAGDNIRFGLRYRPNGALHFDDIVDMLDLSSKLTRKPAQLSGGERQRVALARSLILQPDLLLLDEPLSALDPNLRKQVRSDLRSLQRRTAITFLFITHDQEEALSLSDRIALLNHGRLVQLDAPRNLYLHPNSRFAASFLGPVNWFDHFGLRPELTRLSQLPPEGHRFMPATIEASTFLGNCLHVHARTLSGHNVTAELPLAHPTFHPGQNVNVHWSPDDELRLSD